MALTQALVLFYGVPRFGTQHLYELGIFVTNNNCMGILFSPTVDFFPHVSKQTLQGKTAILWFLKIQNLRKNNSCYATAEILYVYVVL